MAVADQELATSTIEHLANAMDALRDLGMTQLTRRQGELLKEAKNHVQWAANSVGPRGSP